MATVALERIHQQHICPSEDQRSLDVEKEADIIAQIRIQHVISRPSLRYIQDNHFLKI